MTKTSEKIIVPALLFVLFIVFFILSYLSEGSFGGGDTYVHYRLSRYAFQYPQFFLDHWGKPLFTALSSPFAQFGYNGIKTFNIIVGLLSAYFSYRIVKELNYKNAFLVIFLICFCPIYMVIMFSGMTEILFSFVIILSVYLFMKNKYVASAIIISFLPFVRSEGVMILLIFLIAFIVNKQYKSVLFILTGFVFYSIVGYFYYDDILWVINKNPYSSSASQLYGHGELLYYINATKNITGYFLAALLIIGTFVLFYNMFTVKGKETKTLVVNEFILIFLIFFVYLSLQSILWWKGLMAVLGDHRFIAGVVPLIAILGLKGFNLIEKLFSFNKRIRLVLLAAVTVLVIWIPFYEYKIPVQLDSERKVIKEASDWLKTTEYYNHKMYYYDPFFFHSLNLNPYDKNRIQELIPDVDKPENGIAIGEIVLWDAHFSPNEGKLPLSRLMESKFFKLLKVFKPIEEFQTLGGYNYQIFIFQRIPENETIDNIEILKSLELDEFEKYNKKAISYFDFEKESSKIDTNYINNKFSYSGNNSYRLDGTKIYGPETVFRYPEVTDKDFIVIRATAYVYPVYDPVKNPLSLVFSLENSQKTYEYKAVDIESLREIELNKWNRIVLKYKLLRPTYKDVIIKVYVWHRGKQDIFIDDLSIDVFELAK